MLSRTHVITMIRHFLRIAKPFGVLRPHGKKGVEADGRPRVLAFRQHGAARCVRRGETDWILKFNFYLRVFALRNFRPETVRELRGLLGELRSSVSGPVCGR